MSLPRLGRIAVALTCLALAPAAHASEDAAGSASEVAVATDVDGCEVRLRFHQRDGFLDFRSSMCPLGFEDRMRVLKEQLAQLFEDGPLPAGCRQIDLGRLQFFPPFARRLALAAARSGDWDSRRGRPHAGHSNDLVVRLANEHGIYRELVDLFRARGRRARLRSVEKVLVFPAVELPYADWLKTQGVDPLARLPSDAQTWFDLEPLEPREEEGGGHATHE